MRCEEVIDHLTAMQFRLGGKHIDSLRLGLLYASHEVKEYLTGVQLQLGETKLIAMQIGLLHAIYTKIK